MHNLNNLFLNACDLIDEQKFDQVANHIVRICSSDSPFEQKKAFTESLLNYLKFETESHSDLSTIGSATISAFAAQKRRRDGVYA